MAEKKEQPKDDAPAKAADESAPADSAVRVSPAPPGFTPGMNLNSDDARRMYAESGHSFDKIQSKEEPQTFADGSVAQGTAPEDGEKDSVPADKPDKK